ncbi:Cecropin-P2 [Toxocara canis]|uniref:Cecropin-P2 n=1 Tax=Toxocara canis TaxID=6265 RepID=A0A0B2USI9_TOXCA|nr:Cecropin-P2 [Toxocara canis]
MIANRRAILCVLLVWLLALPAQGSWLSKTYNKLENSAKKRISEGIAIAIQGGPRRRRFAPESDVVSSSVEVDEPYVPNFVES